MSRRTLERRFRARFGHSPWQEIRRVQIEHVKNLLAGTDWKLSHIARASAFGTAKRLGQIFREETGESPTTYRSRYRND